MSTKPEGRAWLRVRADALLSNHAHLRRSVGPDVRFIPMVKADAYGLGVDEVVRTLGAAAPRPWGWGVATLGEGLELRELGVRDAVVVFSPLAPAEVMPAVEADLHLGVSSLEALAEVVEAAAARSTVAKVHIDVDTGMGRTGFDWRAAADWLPEIAGSMGERARWIGCFTHLHSAEDDQASVQEQWRRFDGVLSSPAVPPGVLVHVLNSAGAFAAPEHARDAIRPGIFLYGGSLGAGHEAPAPVVSLHARVAHVRQAEPGTTLGYGATYRASRAERWATLSIGYGDGLPRSLGNRGSALLAGHRVPIIGRISMDLTVVDITDLSGVRVGDVATLLGVDGREEITLEDIAELAGTISYEILTGFTRRLPRVWTRHS